MWASIDSGREAVLRVTTLRAASPRPAEISHLSCPHPDVYWQRSSCLHAGGGGICMPTGTHILVPFPYLAGGLPRSGRHRSLQKVWGVRGVPGANEDLTSMQLCKRSASVAPLYTMDNCRPMVPGTISPEISRWAYAVFLWIAGMLNLPAQAA